MRTYHIVTYGCQMNVHDSEGLAGLLAEAGYAPAKSEDMADIVIVNTCAVRERPERKAASKLGALAARKRAGTLAVAGICGCMAQEHGERLLEAHPGLDFVCGTGNLSAVPRLVAAALDGRRGCSLDFLGDSDAVLPRRHNSTFRAYVDIVYGCTNFCSYCIVPTVRGPERSRPSADVVAEVRELVLHGYVEVTLLGQNVNAYGKDLRDASTDFATLLAELDAVEGLRRLRFMTSHPRDFTPPMVDRVAELGSVCEHLHLPVQAGSDDVLRRMNRGYTRDEYLRLVDYARERIPEVSITTDVIGGVPGETDAQFCETMRLFETARFDSAFSFVYVPRPGTAAAAMDDPVPRSEKVARLRALADLQKRISRERNAALVGRTFEVLVDSESDHDPSRLAGRTRTNKLAIFPRLRGVAEGDFVTVRCLEPKLWGFEGEPGYPPDGP